jgi:hypothetical protein
MATIIDYESLRKEQEEKCKECSCCKISRRFKVYTCRLNKRVPLGLPAEERGFLELANPRLCKNATTEYVYPS